MADRVGISEGFLSPALAAHLRDNLNRLYAQQQLHHAATGNGDITNHNTSVRGDKVYWLDRSHDDVHENAFFDLMDRFIAYLNESCYTGITAYEFHYALYEKGSFYCKHVDQFRNNDSRQYSMIMYLNEDWLEGNGGELCVHHSDSLQHISPQSGKSVFFKSSELAHEVLLTHVPRMSITGWLKVN